MSLVSGVEFIFTDVQSVLTSAKMFKSSLNSGQELNQGSLLTKYGCEPNAGALNARG